MTRLSDRLKLVALLCLMPIPVFANAGTPFMLLTFFHLLIGNFAIALLESILLSGRPGIASGVRRFFLFLVANYFTMFAGMALLSFGQDFTSQWIDSTITSARFRFSLVVLAVSTYPMTILLEAPFCFFMIKEKTGRIKRALRYSFAVNTISYPCLVASYSWASYHQFLFEVEVAPIPEVAKAPRGDIYFLVPEGIAKTSTEGGDPELVSDKKFVQLLLQYNGSTYDLVGKDDRHGTPTLALADVADISGGRRGRNTQFDSYSYLTAVDLRKSEVARSSPLRIGGAGIWPDQHAIIDGQKRYQLETLLSPYSIANATILPNDLVVFQLYYPRNSRIVLFDTKSMKIAQLGKGSGPVVAYRNEELGDTD